MSPILTTGAGKFPAIGAAVATAWNPSDMAAGIALSNSNRTATFPSGTKGLRTVGTLSGKQYYEMVLNTVAGPTDEIRFGLANSTHSLTVTLAGSTNAVGYAAESPGVIYINFGSALAAAPTAVQGDTINWATDATAKLLWLRLNNTGNWNGTVGADPATGTSGYDFSTVTGPYYIGADMGQFNDAVTLNIATASWTGTPPSGFANEVTS